MHSEEQQPLVGPRSSDDEQAVPDLRINEWSDLPKESMLAADNENNQNAEKDATESDKLSGGQSVFSERSGIQDLLIRPESDMPDSVEKPTSDKKEMLPKKAAEEAPEVNPKNKKKKGKSKREIERVKLRQKNYLHERRAQKRRQVMFNRIRLLFKLCFAVLLGVLLWEVARSPSWIYQEPAFELQNNHLIQRPQIEPFIQRWVGKPIYAIQTGKLASAIQQRFPAVDMVIVRRQMFPNRLEVQVVEKHPWAEIYVNEKQAKPYGLLVPNDAISLDKLNYQPGQFYKPTLEKILIAPHTKLSQAFLSQLQEITWQAHLIKGLHLKYVDARNPQRIVLHYHEIPVILGRLNVSSSERLARLIPLIPKIYELQKALNSVDLGWEEQVTFHKKPSAKIVVDQGDEEAH